MTSHIHTHTPAFSIVLMQEEEAEEEQEEEEVLSCKQKHPQTAALPLFSSPSYFSLAGVLMTVPSRLHGAPADAAASTWSCRFFLTDQR